ncbi:MAG: alpha/beta fold hydrolase [Candidatus Hodarchaeota archaeon]
MKRKYMRNETFEGTFPFKPNIKEINGFDMHYVDEGKGEPIVCVHGEPTWGYLYRHFITELSKNNRVVVPDHMGFGKSDVPQDKPYVLARHVDNLTKLLLKLDLKNITLIMQDWGGPIGFGFATRNPDLIKRLIILNTGVGVFPEGTPPWYQDTKLEGVPDLGNEEIYNKTLSDMKNFIPIMFKYAIYNQKKVTPIMLKAYTTPFPNKESSIGAVAFPKDIPIGFSHPSANFMLETFKNLKKLSDRPKILIWGLKDPIFPKIVIDLWKSIYRDLKNSTHFIENASHFLQEDASEEIINYIKSFLQKNL